MKRIWSIFKASILTTYREPFLLLFDLLFPIAFYVFMTSIFAARPGEFTFDLYLYTPVPSSLLDQVAQELKPSIRLHFVPTEYTKVQDSLQYVREDALRRRHSPTLIRFPNGWEERLRQGEPVVLDAYISDEKLFYAVIGGLKQKLLEATGQQEAPLLNVNAYPFEQNGSSGANAVALQTLLTFWLISGGMHAVSQYTYLRTSGLKKKLLLSPLRKIELLLELILEPVTVLGLVSAAITALAIWRYDATLLESPLIVILLPISLVVMVTLSASLGILLASLAREPTYGTVGPLAIYLTLMFFSGLAIPVDFFPDFLRQVADWLPPRQLLLGLNNAIEHGYFDLYLFGQAALATLVMLILTTGLMPWKAERR